MNSRLLLFAAVLAATVVTPLSGQVALPEDADADGGGSTALPPYLQCVPYARQVSGIQIFGDAHTWWGQAEGRYARGFRPKVGAVMALRPHGNSSLGHVAAVSRIVDNRTILIRHSNWSPINGRRGQIEDNVRVIDVSEANDWSAVRVWYAPLQTLGGTHWPVQGFIYPGNPAKGEKAQRYSLPEPVPAKGKPAAQAKSGWNSIPQIIQHKLRW